MAKVLEILRNKPFFKFLLVGGTAFIVDYGSFYILHVVLDVTLYLANSLSFGLGLGVSFLLNRLWTFSSADFDKKALHQFSFYVTLALVNLFLTNVLVGLLNHIGVDPRIGKILTIATISIWNFFLYKKLIFVQQKPEIKD